MSIDYEDLIAEARRIVPGVALSVQGFAADFARQNWERFERLETK